MVNLSKQIKGCVGCISSVELGFISSVSWYPVYVGVEYPAYFRVTVNVRYYIAESFRKV